MLLNRQNNENINIITITNYNYKKYTTLHVQKLTQFISSLVGFFASLSYFSQSVYHNSRQLSAMAIGAMLRASQLRNALFFLRQTTTQRFVSYSLNFFPFFFVCLGVDHDGFPSFFHHQPLNLWSVY